MVVTGKGTQVGTYPNTAVSTTFVVSMGGKDVTANYELISVTEGVLTVKYPTILSVSTGSAEKFYDGIPLTCPDYELEVGGDPLPAGYRVSVTVTGSLRGVGKTANTARCKIVAVLKKVEGSAYDKARYHRIYHVINKLLCAVLDLHKSLRE